MNAAGPAFRFGFSFFETLLWNGSAPCRLGAHLRRIHASLDAFGLRHETSDLGPVIAQVAARNGLIGRTARVNIIYHVDVAPDAALDASSDASDARPLHPVVLIAPYAVPSPDRALALGICPRPLHSWLGAHKSANHLPYWLAGREAAAQGLDGAVLTTPDGHVLEASNAALILREHERDGGRYVAPAAPGEGAGRAGILPSTALAAAREVLPIESRPVCVEELSRFEAIYSLNSLIGMLPVTAIGEAHFAADPTPCAMVRSRVHAVDGE
nr:aminotransferase class IV [Desulfobaculum xiamenense]